AASRGRVELDLVRNGRAIVGEREVGLGGERGRVHRSFSGEVEGRELDELYHSHVTPTP
ncbi:MAG: hypothetical protein IIA12_04435, partial [Proteobacteria bacterium]|nr:hypothetical protein [Pseudomonadota bacterium]